MKCLVIAAGRGSRLNSLAESKPLAPVAGVPLIERVIRGAASAGASGFVVVTGYHAPRVEAFLEGLSEALNLPIQPARNAEWERPNGLSVQSAAPYLDGEFLLLMADHLFEPAIVEALFSRPMLDAALTLAVDYRVDDPRIDPEDATKVAIGPGGEIVRIGKLLESYDAFDTGIFRADTRLFDAIRQSVANGGQGSLSEGVQTLADQRLASTMDVGAAWWMDVDDPRALRWAERDLRVSE